MYKRMLYATAMIILPLVSLAVAQKGSDLPTVVSVDIKRYAGQWYEIAKYPNKFQKKCVANTTATYALKDNGRISVINSCLQKDGRTQVAKGEAKIQDKATNAKLKVRFAPGILSWISAVWGDYWIIYLDEQYENVAIGEPGREYFWILSRKPTMTDVLYQDILRKAESLGFQPGKVEKTPQNAEVLKGSVMIKN